jgi:hypothetical protein
MQAKGTCSRELNVHMNKVNPQLMVLVLVSLLHTMVTSVYIYIFVLGTYL